MSELTHFMILIFIIAPAFIMVDWAFYERTINIIYIFYSLEKEYKYKDFLTIYRVLLLTISAGMICYIIVKGTGYGYTAIAGTVLFLLTHFYIFLKIYIENRRK